MPADVLVRLARARLARRVAGGLDRDHDAEPVAASCDHLLLPARRALGCCLRLGVFHRRSGQLRRGIPEVGLDIGHSGIGGSRGCQLLRARPMGATRVDELVVDHADRGARRARLLPQTVLLALSPQRESPAYRDMPSKLDLAAILAAVACGVLVIEHGHQIFTDAPAGMDRPDLAVAACPDNDNMPYPASCLSFLQGEPALQIRRGRT